MKPETLEHYLYRRYTKQSAKTYFFVVSSFLNSNPRAKSYQYKDIVSHFVDLKKRYPKTSTRNNILAGIKRYYDYLVETKQRNDHPCRTFFIRGENIAKRSQVHFQDLFTPTELDMLLNRENRYPNLKTRNKIIISLLIFQGLTSDELVRLDIKNIDFDKSTVYIKASAKLNSRTLKLQRMQMEWIEDYLKTYRKNILKTETNRLLIGHRGEPETVEGIGGMLEPLKSLFPERPLNAKTIRMSVISNWFNVYKLRLESIQEMAGHKWPSSTLRYKRLDIAEQRMKINKWHPLK
jgi:site-specific recombinase XerD